MNIAREMSANGWRWIAVKMSGNDRDGIWIAVEMRRNDRNLRRVGKESCLFAPRMECAGQGASKSDRNEIKSSSSRDDLSCHVRSTGSL